MHAEAEPIDKVFLRKFYIWRVETFWFLRVKKPEKKKMWQTGIKNKMQHFSATVIYEKVYENSLFVLFFQNIATIIIA